MSAGAPIRGTDVGGGGRDSCQKRWSASSACSPSRRFSVLFTGVAVVSVRRQAPRCGLSWEHLVGGCGEWVVAEDRLNERIRPMYVPGMEALPLRRSVGEVTSAAALGGAGAAAFRRTCLRAVNPCGAYNRRTPPSLMCTGARSGSAPLGGWTWPKCTRRWTSGGGSRGWLQRGGAGRLPSHAGFKLRNAPADR